GAILREYDVFPNYPAGAQYANPRARLPDTDNDGIPDNWETWRGLNPGNGSDWKNLVGGYTQLEHYLNELGGYGTTRSNSGGAWTIAANWGGAVPSFADTAVVTGSMTHASGHGFARRLTLDGTASISDGTIDVFDTVLIGAVANGALGISGGTLSSGGVGLASARRTRPHSLNTGRTVQTGQILSGGDTGSLAFNGGTFRAIGAIDILTPIHVGTAGGTINTNGFDGSITGGLSGAGNLSKQGNGTLTLGGNNSSFSGQIGLNAGQITLAANAANSSTGVISLGNGTTLNVATSGASTPIALVGISSATITAGGLTYNGAITGPAGTTLNIANSSTGTSNFSVGGNMSAFTGTINLTSTGNIRIGSTGSALAHFNLGSSTGTIRTTFDGTVHFGSIAGGASTRLQGPTNGTIGSTYVIGANGNSTTFNGTITDGTNTTPAPLSITKTGNGTLTLTGTNIYTGATAISAGTLYDVQSNGTLGGTGTIGGSVHVAGRIAPGAGVGSLTLTGPISFTNGKIAIEIASASSFDVLTVNAPKNLDPAQIEITLLNGFSPLASSSFTVIGGSGAISGALGGLNAWGLITVAGGA
ncbi:MAG TPA: autotransporter-associated beta strand repeat-containing protein, partial [Tepidisphaeraceae bacterium]|nr:autotransporter-associated beta strand repeat-containing protein [Tepidisphaeraceae bacterium]